MGLWSKYRKNPKYIFLRIIKNVEEHKLLGITFYEYGRDDKDKMKILGKE